MNRSSQRGLAQGSTEPTATALRRELGLAGAIMMGLGAMLGTGVFVSIGIAADVAGAAVLPAIALAGLVALCNALSAAQLARAHPVSGGTYEYGYRLLSPALGFAAGWLFLCAKSASAATAALGFAGYLAAAIPLDTGWTSPIAMIAVSALTAVVLTGMRRSNTVNVSIVGITLLALTALVLAGVPSLVAQAQRLDPMAIEAGPVGLSEWLEASALMFVAFTGYGRIATLGEEVRAPRRTIPRAILATIGVAGLLYLAVAAVAITTLGASDLAAATRAGNAPLQRVAAAIGVPGLGILVAIGAMAAMLGVLLNLVLGLSRVVLAMGRRDDLPAATARIDRTGTTPYVATLAVGAVIIGLTLIGRLETAWRLSAFTVLIYYALTNAAALGLSPAARLYPRVISGLGFTGCLGLAFWVDRQSWFIGLTVLAVGLALRRVRRYLRGRGDRP